MVNSCQSSKGFGCLTPLGSFKNLSLNSWWGGEFLRLWDDVDLWQLRASQENQDGRKGLEEKMRVGRPSGVQREGVPSVAGGMQVGV